MEAGWYTQHNRYMNIITQNPYRVIGVFANSKTKERVANINRIKAFIKVNKNTEFPQDLKTVLPEINRSLEDVNNAEANLTLPNDQVKYAQFWFINETSFDEIAFNHLYAGDITKALDIWSKKDNLSSLHNRIVVFLANKDCQKAILLAERFYAEYGTAFINSIADNSNLDAEVIGFNFVDKLCNEFGLNNIMPHISKEDWKEHLSSQAITPIIEELQSAVEAAKTSKGKSPDDRYNAGKKLVNQSVLRLLKLKKLIPPTDLQYQIIADKVGLEVLQCGIDYFNGSVDDDAARKAMPLQQYALRVVVGKMAKDRCDENVKILQKIIDELPPKEIANEIKNIRKKIELFLNSCKNSHSGEESSLYDQLCRKRLDLEIEINDGITLIKECAPYLACIKEFEGIEGDNYINLSSIIVSVVLGKTIEIVNKCLDGYKTLYSHPSSISITELEKVLNKAWEATLYMSVLNVNAELKQRFQTQKIALSTLLLKIGSTPVNSINFKIETETEIYNNCKTVNDYKKYIQLFPNGKYITTAKDKLQRLEHIENNKKCDLLKRIDACQSLNDLFRLKEECLWASILNKLDEKCFSLCKKKKDFKKYINTFGASAKHSEEAETYLNNNKKVVKYTLITTAILAIVGIAWFFPSLFSIICFIIAVIAGIYAYGIVISKEPKGCGNLLITIAIAVLFGLLGGVFSDFAEDKKQKEIEKTKEIEKVKEKSKEKAKEIESRTRYNELKYNTSVDLCEKYLKDFPNFEYSDSVLDMLYNMIDIDKDNIFALYSFINKYPKTSLSSKAYRRIHYVADSLYEEACKTNTVDGWKKYQARVLKGQYRNSQYKIDSLENLVWNTESNAWKEAQRLNNLLAYNKYKELYPHGRHVSQAEKRIIDLEVANVYAGDYGTLPSMDKVSYGSGPTTRITVENNTSYTLTILYSGTDSKRLVIRPNGKSSVTLKNGVYKIAASVNAYNVSKYAGTEHLNGGSYESSYYISTTPSYRHY